MFELKVVRESTTFRFSYFYSDSYDKDEVRTDSKDKSSSLSMVFISQKIKVKVNKVQLIELVNKFLYNKKKRTHDMIRDLSFSTPG